MAGNPVKPLLSLYGTEWRERGYGLRRKLPLDHWPSLEIHITGQREKLRTGQPVKYLNKMSHGQTPRSTSGEPEFGAL